MLIRKAETSDLAAIMGIYAKAKDFMRRAGNPTQWKPGYPGEALIERDMGNENVYVMEEQGAVRAVFSFIVGEDPTYKVIRDGAWHLNAPYGTIHRLASDGTTKGVSKACMDFCKERIPYLRIDTHEHNRPMLRAIENNGFKRCGIIDAADGTERIAFDFVQGSR